MVGDEGEEGVAVAVEFALADAADVGERSAGARTNSGQISQSPVVKDDVGRHALAGGFGAPPGAKGVEQGGVAGGNRRLGLPAPPTAGGYG